MYKNRYSVLEDNVKSPSNVYIAFAALNVPVGAINITVPFLSSTLLKNGQEEKDREDTITEEDADYNKQRIRS